MPATRALLAAGLLCLAFLALSPAGDGAQAKPEAVCIEGEPCAIAGCLVTVNQGGYQVCAVWDPCYTTRCL